MICLAWRYSSHSPARTHVPASRCALHQPRLSAECAHASALASASARDDDRYSLTGPPVLSRRATGRGTRCRRCGAGQADAPSAARLARAAVWLVRWVWSLEAPSLVMHGPLSAIASSEDGGPQSVHQPPPRVSRRRQPAPTSVVWDRTRTNLYSRSDPV